MAPTVAPARGGRWYGREEAGSNTSGIGAWWPARVLPAVAAHHGVPAAQMCDEVQSGPRCSGGARREGRR